MNNPSYLTGTPGHYFAHLVKWASGTSTPGKPGCGEHRAEHCMKLETKTKKTKESEEAEEAEDAKNTQIRRIYNILN